MIDTSLYPMLMKRHSQRKFEGRIPAEKVSALLAYADGCASIDGSRSLVRLVPASDTSCPRGEYCICCYTEDGPYSLINAGYFLEAIDLYAESIGIGVCWYGFGRTKEKIIDGMPFRIMLNIGNGVDLRDGKSLFNRIDQSLFWAGEGFDEVKRDVRLAPSACNSQPWLVESSGDEIIVSRGYGKPSLLKGQYKKYFNLIDMGIFLYFMELSLAANGYAFDRNLLDGNEKIAEYIVRR